MKKTIDMNKERLAILERTRREFNDFFGNDGVDCNNQNWGEPEEEDMTEEQLTSLFAVVDDDELFSGVSNPKDMYRMTAEEDEESLESDVIYRHEKALVSERNVSVDDLPKIDFETRNRLLGTVDTYLATAGIVITATADSKAVGYFEGRLDRIAEMREYMYLREEKVEQVEIPSLGYLTMPATYCHNMSYTFRGSVVRGTGTGEHLHYGARPHVSDYQIPLVRLRTATGWYSFLLLWYKMCPVESDSIAVFEYSKAQGSMILVSSVKPNTNFYFQTIDFVELGQLTASSVHLVDAVYYLVRNEPKFALRAVCVEGGFELQTLQGSIVFLEKEKNLKGNAIYWCSETEVLQASRSTRPYSHELCNAERKAARPADFRTAIGGEHFRSLILTTVREGWYDLHIRGVEKPVSRCMQTRESFNAYLPSKVSRFFSQHLADTKVSLEDFEKYCVRESVYFMASRYQFFGSKKKKTDYRQGVMSNQRLDDATLKSRVYTLRALITPQQRVYVSRFFKEILEPCKGQIYTILVVRAPTFWLLEVIRTVEALGIKLVVLGSESEDPGGF